MSAWHPCPGSGAFRGDDDIVDGRAAFGALEAGDDDEFVGAGGPDDDVDGAASGAVGGRVVVADESGESEAGRGAAQPTSYLLGSGA